METPIFPVGAPPAPGTGTGAGPGVSQRQPWYPVTGAVRAAEAVGVWGVGGLGVHAVQLLRAVGACPVVAVDPSPVARERAPAAGADAALDSAAPASATSSSGSSATAARTCRWPSRSS